MHDVVSQEQKKKEAMINEFIASLSVESTTATADAASFYCTKKQAFTLSLVDTRDNRSVPAAMKTVVLAGNWRVTLPSKAALSEFLPQRRGHLKLNQEAGHLNTRDAKHLVVPNTW